MSKRRKDSPSKTKETESSSSFSIRSPESDSLSIEESSSSSDLATSSSGHVPMPAHRNRRRTRRSAEQIQIPSMEDFQQGISGAKTKYWVKKHNEIMNLNESSCSSTYSGISSSNGSISSETTPISDSSTQFIKSSFGNSPRSGNDMSTLLQNSSSSTTKSPNVQAGTNTTPSSAVQSSSNPINLRIPKRPRPAYFIPLQSVHTSEADKKNIRINLEIVYMAAVFHPSDFIGVVSKTIHKLASIVVPKSRSRIFLYPGQTMGCRNGTTCVRPDHIDPHRAQLQPLTAVTVGAEKGKQLMLTHVFSKMCDSSNTKHMAEGFYMVYAEFHNKKYEDYRFIETTASTIPYSLMQKAKEYVANGIPLFEIVPSNDPRIIPKSKYCSLNDMTNLPIFVSNQEPFLMFDPARPNYRADYPRVKDIGDFLKQFPNPPKSYFYDKEELKIEIDKYVARTKRGGFEQDFELEDLEHDVELEDLERDVEIEGSEHDVELEGSEQDDELEGPEQDDELEIEVVENERLLNPELEQLKDRAFYEYEDMDDDAILGTVRGMDICVRDARAIVDSRAEFTDDLIDGLARALAGLGHGDNFDVISSRDGRYLEGLNSELREESLSNITERLRNNQNLSTLLIPYTTGSHWLLIIVEIQTGTFRIFDPMQPRDRPNVVLSEHQIEKFRRLRSMLGSIFQNSPAFAETEHNDWVIGQQYVFIDEIMPQMDNINCGPIAAGAIAFILGVASDDMLRTLEEGDWAGLRVLLHGILQPYILQPAIDEEGRQHNIV